MEPNNIKLRSEEVQDILSRPPQRLIKWGSSIIGTIFLLLFIGSFFFRYPDTIQADVIITTENPPTWIVARNTGKIKKIYTKDHEYVEKGSLLAIIDNTSSIEDVLLVKKLLENIIIAEEVIPNMFPDDLNLGTIQSVYTTFRKSLEEYNNFIGIDLYDQKIKSLKEQLNEYEIYISHLQNQITLNYKNIYLTEKEHGREKKLYEKDLSSLSTLETSNQKLISAKLSSEQVLGTLSNIRIEKRQLENTLSELKMQHLQELKKIKVDLQSSLNCLHAAIKDWEQKYLLFSPIEGLLSFNNVWKENQNINSGDKIFSVINGSAGKIIGRIQFPVEGSGKVKIGQRVNIKINGYPYMEFGYITGRIETISLLPDNNNFTAVINVPQDLKTSYNKRLHFKGELLGTAEITTENRSIGERILSPFRYMFKKKFYE